MVGDTGTEAGNKRQRGPLARKAWGALGGCRHPPRAQGGRVCARSRWCRRELERALCV